MIKITGVDKFFKLNNVKKYIFKDLNFSVKSGDLIKITGPNGSGKTTLLRLLNRITLPDKGEVVYGPNLQPNEVSIVSQNQRSFFLNLTVMNNLQFFSDINGNIVGDSQKKINEQLEKFGLLHKSNSQMSSLSSGQLKKIAIIRSLLARPKILLLDEVNSTLEESARKSISEYVVNELNGKFGTAVIWTTHYPNELNTDLSCDYIVKNNNLIKTNQQ
tara:strand:- start:513 stop:1163 length:651 start_codon:yes stop_codon:yes gene_type:complete